MNPAFFPDGIVFCNKGEDQQEFAEWKARRAEARPSPQAEEKPAE